jgi:hypothetical protein
LDQHTENIEGSHADGDGNKNAALIAPGQAFALPIEAKFLEQENVRGGEHAPVSRVPASFRPGEGSRMGSDADVAAIQQDLQPFLENFYARFLAPHRLDPQSRRREHGGIGTLPVLAALEVFRGLRRLGRSSVFVGPLILGGFVPARIGAANRHRVPAREDER